MSTDVNVKKKHHIIPIFISHQGCPFQCIFCNQSKINGKEGNLSAVMVAEIIERHLQKPKSIGVVPELAFFGGSFTCMPLKRQNEFLTVARKYKQEGKISLIRLSTRPDCITVDILQNLLKFQVDIVELGVQSMDDEVLFQSKRGYASIEVVRAALLLKEFHFQVGLQMMVGLPGDNYEKIQYTAKHLSKLSADFVRIYPALVIRDTELEYDYRNGNYTPLPLTDAVNICVDLLFFFNNLNIPVIRLGLQASENISWGGDVIAGPFHPSFRQLVESARYRVLLDKFFSKLTLSIFGKQITVQCRKEEISNVIGQNRENFLFLSRRFGISDIKFIANGEDDFVIRIEGEEYRPDFKELSEEYLVSKLW